MTELPASWRTQGYATGHATKQLIVSRSSEAFAKKGFYGASMRAIAREAGVDHSTLLHHFGNKVALLLAVLEWHDLQSMPDEVPTEITPELLVAGFTEVARQNEESPGLVALLSTLSAEAGTPGHPARDALRTRHEALIEIIGSMIRTQREKGAVLDDGLTPEQGAGLIIATWEGLQVYSALHPGAIDVPTQVEQLLRRAFGIA